MSEIINLKTRYHTKNYLEQYQGNTYILRTESPYIRAGSTNDGKEFVDPSGGPMIVQAMSLRKPRQLSNL